MIRRKPKNRVKPRNTRQQHVTSKSPLSSTLSSSVIGLNQIQRLTNLHVQESWSETRATLRVASSMTGGAASLSRKSFASHTPVERQAEIDPMLVPQHQHHHRHQHRSQVGTHQRQQVEAVHTHEVGRDAHLPTWRPSSPFRRVGGIAGMTAGLPHSQSVRTHTASITMQHHILAHAKSGLVLPTAIPSHPASISRQQPRRMNASFARPPKVQSQHQKGQAASSQKSTLSLSSVKLAKLPTPYAVLLGEELLEEQQKRLADPSTPLDMKGTSFKTFDLPLMSKTMVPSERFIASINRQLREQGVTDPKKLLPLPSELPGFDKLTITEQLLLKAGLISQVSGTSQYAYLPLAKKVLEKLENVILHELNSFGYQRVDIPSFLEKSYLDNWFNRTTHQPDMEESLPSNQSQHPLSPYYRLFTNNDEEMIVSPAIYEYYTDIIRTTVRSKQQLPMGLFQLGKKYRDIDDLSSVANGSTNIDYRNQHIAQRLLTETREKQQRLRQLLQSDDATEEEILKAQQDYERYQAEYVKKQSLIDGTITSREYTAVNAVSFHADAKDAHQMYKAVLDMYYRVFKKLNVTAVQVEGDGSSINSELSHEYHIIMPATTSPAVKQPTTCTHAILQCGLCGYSANTQKAQFAVQEQFDQSTHLTRMKTGNLTYSMRNDPRSFGMFEASSSGDPNFDREIRSKMTSMIKLMVPTLVRRDVPIVANVVKLHFADVDSAFSIDYEHVSQEDKQFMNHTLILLRADRELNDRAVAAHFGCSTVEVLPASESALLLLKFQKYKQKQHERRVKTGELDVDQSASYNIYEDIRNKQFHMDDSKFKAMYKDLDDVKLLEAEQKRIRQRAAREDVQGGLIIVVDNTLVPTGIDVDEESMMSRQFLEGENVDRSFSIPQRASNQSSSKSLVESMTGLSSPADYSKKNIVPPEFSQEFDIILRSIQDGILSVDEHGEITLHAPENTELPPEFIPVDSGSELESGDVMTSTKRRQNVIDIEESPPSMSDDNSSQSEGEESGIEQIIVDGVKVYNDTGVTSPEKLFQDAVMQRRRQDTQNTDIFGISDDDNDDDNDNDSETNSSSTRASRRTPTKQHKENETDDELVMYKNPDGDLVDQDGNILPHMTADLRSTRDVRMAFGKKGYDDVYGDSGDMGGLMHDEHVTSAINPGQGDFSSPLPGDRCVQKQCQGQGILDGLRSIEVGKTYYLGDTLSRATGAVVFDDLGKERPVHTTSYKIGVSRLMHAIVESIGHDSHGIIWPELIAPYQISIMVDPTSEVARKATNKSDDLDVYEKYVVRSRKAEKQYYTDRVKEKERLINLRNAGLMGDGLDKERNRLIDQAIDVIDIDDPSDVPKFGVWDWGIADNHTHAINIASKVAQLVPGMEQQVVYDDRLDMSLDERIQDSFSIGIPWTVVVDDLMQQKGLIKVINRSTRSMEYLSADQIIHLFNGQRPVEDRLEHNSTEFEREMRYKVENAVLAHFGRQAVHGGDPEALKIDHSKKTVFDYNTHVSYKTSYTDENSSGDEGDDISSGLKDGDNDTPSEESISTLLKKRQQAEQDEGTSKDDFAGKKRLTPKGRSKKNALHPDVVEVGADQETLDDITRQANEEEDAEYQQQLESQFREIGDQKEQQSVPGQGGNPDDNTKDKATDYQAWYSDIKGLRGPLPPPTNVEVDRMFKAGILFNDDQGVVRVNVSRANTNMHVVLGVDQDVVKQYKRGSLVRTTGANGVMQIIDRDVYLQDQRRIMGQRIDREIKEGRFSVQFQKTLETIQNKERAIGQIEAQEAKLQGSISPITQEDLRKSILAQEEALQGGSQLSMPSLQPSKKKLGGGLGLSALVGQQQKRPSLSESVNNSFDTYKDAIIEPSRKLAKEGVVFRNISSGRAEYYSTKGDQLRVDNNDVKHTAFQSSLPGSSRPRGTLFSPNKRTMGTLSMDVDSGMGSAKF